ncbi:MAG: hypothetical protein R2784_10935 [Saprospiraceae bacterium]
MKVFLLPILTIPSSLKSGTNRYISGVSNCSKRKKLIFITYLNVSFKGNMIVDLVMVTQLNVSIQIGKGSDNITGTHFNLRAQ